MKFLHTITSMSPETGGPAQGIRNMAAALKCKGIHIEVVSCDEPNAPWIGMDDFPLHALGPGRLGWGFHPDWIPWLRANVQRFDAVIVHGVWLYSCYAARQVLGRKSKLQMPPFFIMPHGMLDPWFQKTPERRLKAWRNSVYWHLIEKRAVREAAGVLFTCQQELDLARTTFWDYRPQREINVGYGITKPPPHKEGQEAFEDLCPQVHGRPYLLFLSRIHPKKGLDLLLQTYAQLWIERCLAGGASDFPALVIAGPLGSTYARHMQLLATDVWQQMASASQSIPPPILFPGMLQGDAKWSAVYGCEAFVLPSHQENFGIAVVEALACGKPVLISNQVNIWREIHADGAGLVEADTLEGTCLLLRRWLGTTKQERLSMGRRARACYEQHFDSSKAADKLIRHIHAVLSLQPAT